MTEIAKKLTTSEAEVLADCEETISHGLQTFVEVGTALSLIRDNRLYRADHQTFEAYCQDRWQLSRPRAYELMTAAQVVSGMPDTDRPSNARQAVELARVPEPERAEVWARANEATDGKPTAAAVREAANPSTPSGDRKADAQPASAHTDGEAPADATSVGAGETAAETFGASVSVDADGEGTITDPVRADAAGAPTDLSAAGAPVNPLDDPVQIERARRERTSERVAAGLVHLHGALDPDPIRWLTTWVPDAYKNRGIPYVEDILTPTGIRTVAKHLNVLADYLDKTEGSL